MTPEAQLKLLGLTLPPAPKAGGIYSPVRITGNQLYVSGQPPCREDGSLITGKVGLDLNLEEVIYFGRESCM